MNVANDLSPERSLLILIREREKPKYKGKKEQR
jgi:hypothetical protein